jgi:hypothetical protein
VRLATRHERRRSGFGLRVSFESRISDFGFPAERGKVGTPALLLLKLL